MLLKQLYFLQQKYKHALKPHTSYKNELKIDHTLNVKYKSIKHVGRKKRRKSLGHITCQINFRLKTKNKIHNRKN